MENKPLANIIGFLFYKISLNSFQEPISTKDSGIDMILLMKKTLDPTISLLKSK